MERILSFWDNTLKKVYAFDIQQLAIDTTIDRCSFLKNVCIHLDLHKRFDKYVNIMDAGIFNLGYLPQSDKTITTNANTVIATLDKIWNKINDEGRVVVVLYPRFKEGKEEAKMMEKYCATLISKRFDVMKYQLINRKDAPYIICIDYHQ